MSKKYSSGAEIQADIDKLIELRAAMSEETSTKYTKALLTKSFVNNLLNRIGVNYSQDVRRRNAAEKNGTYRSTGSDNLSIDDLNYMNELLKNYKKLIIKTGEVLSNYV